VPLLFGRGHAPEGCIVRMMRDGNLTIFAASSIVFSVAGPSPVAGPSQLSDRVRSHILCPLPGLSSIAKGIDGALCKGKLVRKKRWGWLWQGDGTGFGSSFRTQSLKSGVRIPAGHDRHGRCGGALVSRRSAESELSGDAPPP
jgi:hypothetical protein